MFYGIEITKKCVEPFTVLKETHVLYFNIALTGNQKIFGRNESEYKTVDTDDFGKAFIKEYGVPFTNSLGTLYILMHEKLLNGKIPYLVWNKVDFIDWIKNRCGSLISEEAFFDLFSLTKERITSQLNGDETFIWKMNANQYRHELRPFICLDDGTLFMSYAAIDQAFQLWNAYFVNGGMIYLPGVCRKVPGMQQSHLLPDKFPFLRRHGNTQNNFSGSVRHSFTSFLGGLGYSPASISAGSGYTPYACYVTFPHYYDTTTPPFCSQNAKK